MGQYKRTFMKLTLTLAALLVIGQGQAAAQRAAAPADATVFIRLVGSVRVELDEAGSGKQTTELDRVEIGTGSGFVISPHGYVLTNEHVVSNSAFTIEDGPRKARFTLKVGRIDVCFAQGATDQGPGRCFEASVHSADAELDLAVLFISASDLPYVALGDSDVLRPGESVDALGYPFGRQLEVGRVAAPDLVPEISTAAGTISAVRAGETGERRALQINSTINPGNSGGPVLDQDGFAVGVIRAQVTGNSGIGFAIPINQVKDFLESRGLEPLMPSRRLRLGPLHTFEGKGIAIRLPEGLADTSPFRSRVETDPAVTSVALRIDRGFSPWNARRMERVLVESETFERVLVEVDESQMSTRSGSALLHGRATGTTTVGEQNVRMHYGIIELGAEKLIARYVGSEEQLAYNESVVRDSILSLDGRRLIAGEMRSIDGFEWVQAGGSVAALNVPMPAGWVLEPGAPTVCTSLPQASTTGAMYPANDVTLALRAAVWDSATISPEDAAGACSARRGSGAAASYTQRADWLGVSYSIAGTFIRVGSRQMQLEVISPDRKSPIARALLAAWIKQVAR
jgi:S1-C subfamily serine protease